MRYDGPKATVENLTVLGVRQAEAWCQKCHHRAWLPLDRFPARAVFVSIKAKLVCAECGNTDIELSPDWRDHRPSGRM